MIYYFIYFLKSANFNYFEHAHCVSYQHAGDQLTVLLTVNEYEFQVPYEHWFPSRSSPFDYCDTSIGIGQFDGDSENKKEQEFLLTLHFFVFFQRTRWLVFIK